MSPINDLENLVVGYLRRIDRNVDGLGVDLRDIRVRLASIDVRLAGLKRLIEQRLDLRDA